MTRVTRTVTVLTQLLVVAIAGVTLVGCSKDTGATAAIERIRALDRPLVVDATVHADFLDGDSGSVLMVDGATAKDARTVWCEVMVPNGLGSGGLFSDGYRVEWIEPQCRDKKDMPRRLDRQKDERTRR